MFVAGGAALIALKETWSLVRAYAWATWIFWVLVAVMFVASVAWTGYQANRRQEILGTERGRPRSARES